MIYDQFGKPIPTSRGLSKESLELLAGVQEESLKIMRNNFGPRLVTLYDQFSQPVYVPSSQSKIGETIIIKRPPRFVAQ